MSNKKILEFSQADICNLNEAEGWLGLDNYAEAHRALGRINPKLHMDSAVLSMRWHIFGAERRYEEAWQVSEAMCRRWPNHVENWLCQANSVRQAKGLPEAIHVLKTARRRFKDNANIPYNMACYSAQLGDKTAAEFFLNQAFELDTKGELIEEALFDDDLKPLRSKIRARVQQLMKQNPLPAN